MMRLDAFSDLPVCCTDTYEQNGPIDVQLIAIALELQINCYYHQLIQIICK